MINKKPVPGHIYAIHTGTYAGQMLLFIKEDALDYCFLSVPEMRNFTIPCTVFEHGIKTNIVKYVETAPKYVLKVSTAQYKINNKTKPKQNNNKVEE